MIPMMSESFAEEIKIPFGETISYEELKFYFYDIEDSRCPSDVTCIWEGKILAMIRVSNDTHDVGGPRDIGFVQKSFEPYSIRLKNVEPYPISTEKPDYVAVLEITKSESRPDEFTDEQICGVGNVIVDGICVNPNYENFDVGLNQVTLFISVAGIVIGIAVFVIWKKRK